MTVVLVHGVPESDAVWEPVIEALNAGGYTRLLRLSPPGFGVPLPRGFGATVTEYKDWLIAEIAKVGEPVHLVGHDWGGGHAMAVAIERPDLLRSWATDVIGVFEPDYVWHEYAQIFQTPEEGERQLAIMFGGNVDDRAARLREVGILPAVAEKIASKQGSDMAKAILALYRSAVQPVMADIGRKLADAAARPGLALIATEDHAVGSFDAHCRGAKRSGAQVAVLQGRGHWWMNEDPANAADTLASFWGSL